MEGKKTCNTLHSHAIDKLTVHMGAVGIHPMAVDNS
jgi:hypothetical protein